jgi:chitinase
MKRLYIKVGLAILFFFFSTLVVAQAKEIVAYFIEWGVYNQPPYYVKNIETSGAAEKITVLNYAFAIPAPDETGNIVVQLDDPYAAYQQIYDTDMSIDGNGDDDTINPLPRLRGHFNQLKKLKLDYPDLKIVISIGGWTGSTYFSDAALTAESRYKFVKSCIDMFIRGDLPIEGDSGGTGVAASIFDGIDIDWEYPITGGDAGTHHNSNDDVNFSLLLEEFRNQLNAIRIKLDLLHPLLLTAATPASDFRAQNFRINHDQQYVDWFLLMSYDFHGTWERTTGHLTNLLTSPDDPSSDAFKLSMDNTVRLYRDTYDVPSEKLIPGATFYGRGWKGVSSTNDGLYQSGRPASGIYEDGYNYYVDLVPLLGQSYTMFWDDKAMAAWLYSSSDQIFWTLDEPQSLALKKRYVDAYDLGGIMFWEISGDDSQGTLVNTLYTGNPPSDNGCGDPPSNNVGPTVSITDPENCGISFEGFNVIINTDASDSDGCVTQVEFFVDSQSGSISLGYDTQPPYSWAWFNVPSGTYKLTAVATDNAGESTPSTPITVTVKSAASGITLWQTGVMYQAADLVFYEGCIYECKKAHMGSRVRVPSPRSKYWQLSTCSDCGGPTPYCGDNVCDPGEDVCNGTGGYVCEDCGTPLSTETNCSDNKDNDCDSYTDCDDIDCGIDSACQVACNGDGKCDPGEDCNTCPDDCASYKKGKPAGRYCCGNGVAEGPEVIGDLCNGNI